MKLIAIESLNVNNDWNFTGLDLFPAFNSGISINAAAGNEDNMALINLGTGYGFRFFKRA